MSHQSYSYGLTKRRWVSCRLARSPQQLEHTARMLLLIQMDPYRTERAAPNPVMAATMWVLWLTAH